MKKSFKIIIPCTCLALIGIGISTYLIYNNRFIYEGSETKTENKYNLNFSSFNGEKSTTLYLKENEELNIFFNIDKGEVNLFIKDSESNNIYQGNKIETAKFILTIEKNDEFIILINAKHAEGFINIWTKE